MSPLHIKQISEDRVLAEVVDLEFQASNDPVPRIRVLLGPPRYELWLIKPHRHWNLWWNSKYGVGPL